MFDILSSDIIVMQELKIQRKDLRDDMVLLDGWDAYFSLPKHKKGYSGVGIYTRNATCAPIRAEEGLLGVLPSASGVPYCELPDEESVGGYPSAFQVAELGVDPAALDAEGRCLVLEFPAFVLFGVYSPANSNGMRDDFRYGFISALDCRIRNLIRMGKRVVLVGDLNVSRDEKDTAKAFEDCRKNGITHEDYISTPNRRIFNQLLVGGEVAGERDEGREKSVLWDTTRGFHPTRKGMYTHWEQKINARPGNFGSRIDFVLVTESMKEWIKDANIQEGLLGSDHCPVFADFNVRVKLEEGEVALADIMNPPGVFVGGERMQEWKVQEVPALSAKKMPEFDKRRSIMSMFSASKSPAKLPEKKTIDDAPPPSEPGALSTSVEVASAETSQTADESTEVPAMKRKVSVGVKEKPAKRQKPDMKVQNSNGQQSLKGFFRKQDKQAYGPSATDEVKEKGSNFASNDISPVKTSSASASAHNDTSQENDLTNDQPTPPTDLNSPIESASPSPSDVSNQLAANEQTQRSWNALFTKPASPLCEGHNEPCKTMQTKKKGSNQGRSFWMCARPLGPSGEKERGTQWRCGTFIWCSDWTGKKEGKGSGTG
jgi:AP endonuclease-2